MTLNYFDVASFILGFSIASIGFLIYNKYKTKTRGRKIIF